MHADPAAAIVDLYERTAPAWAAVRGQELYAGEYSEAEWLDAFVAPLPPGASILDVGCGNGVPIARELQRRGFRITGVDSSSSMIANAERELPRGRWLVGDMRELELDETFDGVLAWHSFFHLTEADQRRTLPRLARRLAPGGRLMITTGPVAGVSMGRMAGRTLIPRQPVAGRVPELVRAQRSSCRAVRGRHAGRGRADRVDRGSPDLGLQLQWRRRLDALPRVLELGCDVVRHILRVLVFRVRGRLVLHGPQTNEGRPGAPGRPSPRAILAPRMTKGR